MPPGAYTYPWPRPAVTVDVALFTVAGLLTDLRLRVLLIQRDEPPWAGMWALPGGFVRENEDLPAAAARELEEEAGVHDAWLGQVEAVGTPGRDTRGHVITVVYLGLTPKDRHHLLARGDARAANWFDVVGPDPLPALAFDHADLLGKAVQHLRNQLDVSPICREMLPESFTLSELQVLVEAIRGRAVDRRNFRRKVLDDGLVVPAPGRREGSHRPAQLYRFADVSAGRSASAGSGPPSP